MKRGSESCSFSSRSPVSFLLRRGWGNELLLPAYASAISVVLVCLYGIVFSKRRLSHMSRSRSEDGDSGEVEALQPTNPASDISRVRKYIGRQGGLSIFSSKLLRLVGCMLLVGLTAATVVVEHKNEANALAVQEPNVLYFGKFEAKLPNSELAQLLLCGSYVSRRLNSECY